METLIFGEAHFKVSKIREQIVRLNPQYILHELAHEERGYYKQKLPAAKLIPIDKDVPKTLPLVKRFELREKHMLQKIKQYHGKGTVAVVVGDTHLRSIRTEELGPSSPLLAWAKSNAKVKVIRSLHKEIA